MARLFAKSAGNADLLTEEDLDLYLHVASLDGVYQHIKHEQAARRNIARRKCLAPERMDILIDRHHHDAEVSRLLMILVECLGADERYVLEQRMGGRDWADLAQELQCPPGALRMHLCRKIERILHEE